MLRFVKLSVAGAVLFGALVVAGVSEAKAGDWGGYSGFGGGYGSQINHPNYGGFGRGFSAGYGGGVVYPTYPSYPTIQPHVCRPPVPPPPCHHHHYQPRRSTWGFSFNW